MRGGGGKRKTTDKSHVTLKKKTKFDSELCNCI